MSSNSGWRWDYKSKQWVGWSQVRTAWVNERDQIVQNPQFDPPVASSSRAPNVTSSSSNASARKSSAAVSKSARPTASLESALQELSVSRGDLGRAKNPSNAPRKHLAVDPSSGAETRWALSLSNEQSGSSVRSHDPKRVLELEGRKNQHVLKGKPHSMPVRSVVVYTITDIFLGYHVSEKPSSDYKRGRVIEVLLVPPDAPSSATSGITPNEAAVALPPRTIARLRRFVIFRENVDGRTFEAVAIKTYNGQGVAAKGVIKSHHAIIYTGALPSLKENEQPRRLPNGQPENGVLPQPIRVEAYDRGTALDNMARLDYGDRFVFDYGVPNIRLWGRVHPDYHAPLYVQYTQVWGAIQRAALGVTPAPNPSADVTTQSTTTEVPPTRIDFSTPDSGPISDDAVTTLLRQYEEYADRNNLSMPSRRLNQAEIRTLARDSARRATYLRQIRDRWQEEVSNNRDDDDDDDDDDDED